MLEKDVLIKLVDAMTNDLEFNKKKLRLHFGNIKLDYIYLQMKNMMKKNVLKLSKHFQLWE